MSKQQSIKGYAVEELDCEEIELFAHSCAPYDDDRTDENETVDFMVSVDSLINDMMHS